MNSKLIVSSSFGKDSTAMIHKLLEHGEKIAEVIYFECEWDFPQMENHIAKVVANTGIEVTRVRNYRRFSELVKRYGMPHPSGGWCTDRKTQACNKIIRALKGTVECIGFTTDELHRAERINKKWEVRFPLIEFGMSEQDCLDYCYSLGYDWEGLYEVFNRVSCFCCPKAGAKRIEQLKEHYPELYAFTMKLRSRAMTFLSKATSDNIVLWTIYPYCDNDIEKAKAVLDKFLPVIRAELSSHQQD